jgi:hypothetical protein
MTAMSSLLLVKEVEGLTKHEMTTQRTSGTIMKCEPLAMPIPTIYAPESQLPVKTTTKCRRYPRKSMFLIHIDTEKTDYRHDS